MANLRYVALYYSMTVLLYSFSLGEPAQFIRGGSEIEAIPIVDGALVPYINDFYSEKKKYLPSSYGYPVFAAQLGAPTIPGAIGQCNYAYSAVTSFILPYPGASHGFPAGEYYEVGFYYRFVTIDKSFWALSSHQEKRLVVFHEMSHCHLDLDHREEVDNQGKIKSIMYPRILTQDGALDKKDEDYYISTAFDITGPKASEGLAVSQEN